MARAVMNSLQSAMLHRCALALVSLVLPFGSDAGAQTLDRIKQRGAVACGINPGLLGFSSRDSSGAWRGFDVDLCRALAAAIFDDPNKVQFVPLGTAER